MSKSNRENSQYTTVDDSHKLNKLKTIELNSLNNNSDHSSVADIVDNVGDVDDAASDAPPSGTQSPHKRRSCMQCRAQACI